MRNVTGPTVQELTDSLLERRAIDAREGGLAGTRVEFAGLQGTITDVLVRVEMRTADSRPRWCSPRSPGLRSRRPQGPLAVAGDYLVHGIQHILFGVDHLLFVLGLLLIVKDRWMLLKTVTAFTVAHSITLGIATLGYANAPVCR